MPEIRKDGWELGCYLIQSREQISEGRGEGGVQLQEEDCFLYRVYVRFHSFRKTEAILCIPSMKCFHISLETSISFGRAGERRLGNLLPKMVATYTK